MPGVPSLPTVDAAALLRGAAVAVAVSMPAGLLYDSVAEHDHSSPLLTLLFLLFLLGFVAAGAVASRSATVAPLVTGGLAALAALVAAQVVVSVVRLLADEGVQVAGVVFNGLLAYGCGLTGAVLAERRRARR